MNIQSSEASLALAQKPLAIPSLGADHVLRDTDLSGDELRALLTLAVDVKARPEQYRSALEGKYAAMLFEKPSLRTRVTFELAMKQLGGDADLGVSRLVAMILALGPDPMKGLDAIGELIAKL